MANRIFFSFPFWNFTLAIPLSVRTDKNNSRLFFKNLMFLSHPSTNRNFPPFFRCDDVTATTKVNKEMSLVLKRISVRGEWEKDRETKGTQRSRISKSGDTGQRHGLEKENTRTKDWKLRGRSCQRARGTISHGPCPSRRALQVLMRRETLFNSGWSFWQNFRD